MKCSRCGAEVARATPGKLPLCPQCDAVLRPPEKQPTFNDVPAELPRKEGFIQFLSNELGQYKTQWLWLMVGVGIFGFLMLALLCCSCGFFLPIDTRSDE